MRHASSIAVLAGGEPSAAATSRLPRAREVRKQQRLEDLRDRKGPGTGGTYLTRERSPGKQGMTFGHSSRTAATQRQSFGDD
jgi:hypothetical protein